MLSDAGWKAVEVNIMSGVGATLQVDGMKVNFRLGRIQKNGMRLAIVIAEDVATLEKWYSEDCLERRLFFRRVTTSAWSLKDRLTIAKMSKARRKRLGIDAGMKLTRYFPWWTQFGQLKNHLSRHAKAIEVLFPEV